MYGHSSGILIATTCNVGTSGRLTDRLGIVRFLLAVSSVWDHELRRYQFPLIAKAEQRSFGLQMLQAPSIPAGI
jgi:hypothetical protein